jgi:hypothetical protein
LEPQYYKELHAAYYFLPKSFELERHQDSGPVFLPAECRQGEQAMGTWDPSFETIDDQGSKTTKDQSTKIAKDVTEVREQTDLQTCDPFSFLMN